MRSHRRWRGSPLIERVRGTMIESLLALMKSDWALVVESTLMMAIVNQGRLATWMETTIIISFRMLSTKPHPVEMFRQLSGILIIRHGDRYDCTVIELRIVRYYSRRQKPGFRSVVLDTS